MATGLVALILVSVVSGAPVPTEFPSFVVPGHEKEMDSLRGLYWLHYEPAGPLDPAVGRVDADGTLWPATGAQLRMRTAGPRRWRRGK